MKAFRLTKSMLLIMALLIAAVFYLFYSIFSEEEAVYVTVKGEYRDLKSEVYATGILAGQVEVDVGAQVSGQILKIYVNNGDKVKQGDLLCEIDPQIQENNLARAKAEELLIKAQIGAKKAQLEQLKSEHLRQQKLLKNSATSSYEAESAKASYLVAKYDLEALEAQLQQASLSVSDAETNLSYTRITAPMDGTVYAVLVEEGQTVNANQTTPTILRLAMLDTMTVEAEISEADVVKVKEGMESSFTILGLRNKEFKSVLKSIDPAPDSAASENQSNTSASTGSNAIYYNALFDVDNKEGILRIDMTANVTIITDKKENVLAVPVTALRNDDYVENASVIIMQDGALKSVAVKTGIRDSYFVEIVSGLDGSEDIVLGDDVATQEAKALANAQKKPPRPPRGI